MQRRYMAIWFRYLLTDGMTRRRPELKGQSFVLSETVKNRVIIKASSKVAENHGVFTGMSVADARAALPELLSIDAVPGHETKLLHILGLICIRYTPVVFIDLPDGLLLDISGCPHIWGNEQSYYRTVYTKLNQEGFDVRITIADTIGIAWAVARFGKKYPIIQTGIYAPAIASFSPASLRLEPEILDRLKRLGFGNIGSLFDLPPQMLRRRFGKHLLMRINQALGRVEEYHQAIIPAAPYSECLHCLEPVLTATAIELAIEKLLEKLCLRLQNEDKGVRKAFLKCHRIDGKRVQISISTTKGSHSVSHLLRLFKLQVVKIEPALGIELFILDATATEKMENIQEQLWAEAKGLADNGLAELLDRIAGKVGIHNIQRFLPAENYWPERSVKRAVSLTEEPDTAWPKVLRPIRLLSIPEPVEVMALVPDHPPKMFIYKGRRHDISKADGPERISREWWQDSGEHRDYYILEDRDGQRYWVFRSGHYDGGDARWYLHGYFA